MIPNNKPHCPIYNENYFINSSVQEQDDAEDFEDDEKNERQRLAGYIVVIIAFFYILFTYLI